MLVSTDRIVAAARRLARGEVDPIDRVGRFPAAAGRTRALEVDDLPLRQPRPDTEDAVTAHGTVEGTPIKMPFGDLTVSEGKLVKWYCRLGDSVAQGDHVADIETDKAVVEIESPASGILAEILAGDGATVAMGSPIGIVREAN
jgi:2-oxoisovalerate dehydrogenase E1 component